VLKKLFSNTPRLAQFEVTQLQSIFKEVKITFLQARHFFFCCGNESTIRQGWQNNTDER
jgi:hypothetical protein